MVTLVCFWDVGSEELRGSKDPNIKKLELQIGKPPRVPVSGLPYFENVVRRCMSKCLPISGQEPRNN
jgi:hypothetical protein